MLKQPEFRVGIGYDSHRLVPDRPLIVGGVTIPFESGLKGHSDGDVLLHAITDALCGAAGLPDIGQLFPDTEQRWLNADSWNLLREVGVRVRAKGWQPVNVDAVLIAQRPKISPYVPQMRERIAQALEIEIAEVNVRGKTAEGMDAVGAGQGMISHAVCLLKTGKGQEI
jgi:2-C-methyl-D-erythritol 2,4-cyclodiphosphate synthase